MQTPHAVERWQRASGDLEGLCDVLAEDVRLISPLTEQFHFQGRAEVIDLLEAVFEVFKDVRWDDVLGDGDTWALFGSGRVAGQPVQEAQRLRLDDEGHIAEITLFVRPLPGATALMTALGPRLARGQGRRGLAMFLAVATRPLHAMTKSGERWIVPLAAPARDRAAHRDRVTNPDS